MPGLMDAIHEGVKQLIPTDIRTYGMSVLGDRSPITNANFTQAELDTLRNIITTDQAKLPERANQNDALAQAMQHRGGAQAQREAANATARAAHERQGIGAIGYAGGDTTEQGRYPAKSVRINPLGGGWDYEDRNLNALANTIGQFVYKTQPDGSVKIDDNYNWGATRGIVSAYGEKPPTTMDLIKLLMHGNIEGAGAALMPDAAHGRPVHIVLPKGGQ